MGQFWKAAVLCAAVMFAPGAHAQSAADMKTCTDFTNPTAGHAACTRLLASGKLGRVAVSGFKSRAIHSSNKQDYDAAIADFSEVINLQRRIATRGIEIRKLFDLVRDDVMAATNRQQQPYSYGSVPGSEDFYF